MKVQLSAGATVDLLNKDELGHELKPLHEAAAWAREVARGVKHIDMPILTGPVVTAGFVLGGRENAAGPPICGPNPGFYWRIERVTITGFIAAETAVCTLYKTSQTGRRAVCNIPLTSGTGVYHPGGSALILRPDDNLILAVGGTIASPANTTIFLNGEADEAPGPLVYKLIV